MSNGELHKTLLPALRGKMGDWIYYITCMHMRDIANKVRFAKEVHPSEVLQELIQRQLTDRSKEISEYLLKQKERFFNSIIVGVYGGSPKWYELSVESNKYLQEEDVPDGVTRSIGILELSGAEEIFALDGQHRVAAIRQVSTEGTSLDMEEVPMIFLAHKNDRKGRERTRRLFTTLNRYAKPVSLRDIIALDEDDPIAITTRKLLIDYPLFTGERIAAPKSKAIPKSNRKSLTTIVTLYEVLDIVLTPPKTIGKKLFKRFRPDNSVLNKLYDEATDFWDEMIKRFRSLKQLQDEPLQDEVAARYRHSEGGHLLFRPVGLLSVARAVKTAKANGVKQSRMIQTLSRMPVEICESPWSGLLWDTISKRMITRKENQKVASSLMVYIAGITIDSAQLKKSYASALNKPENEIELPGRLVH